MGGEASKWGAALARQQALGEGLDEGVGNLLAVGARIGFEPLRGPVDGTENRVFRGVLTRKSSAP